MDEIKQLSKAYKFGRLNKDDYVKALVVQLLQMHFNNELMSLALILADMTGDGEGV